MDLKKKKILALCLAVFMVITLLPSFSLQSKAAGTVTLGNQGYPYSTGMTNENLNLSVQVDSGTATSYQWQVSTAKNGTYENISGATSASYTFTPVDGSWYKCVVNGSVETYPVQAVRIKQNEEHAGAKFLVVPTTTWGLGNGAMVYTYNSEAQGVEIWGRYHKNDTWIWVNSTCYNYWKMTTSANETGEGDGKAQLDAFYVSFSNKVGEEHGIIFEADLADGQKAFAISADTMLGSSDDFQQYADRASLKAIIKNDVLQQIQMITAKSVEDAVETDAALVFMPEAADMFWIGRYGSRKTFSYNKTAADDNYIHGTGIYEDIVVEVQDIDSGMTISWTDIESGGRVKLESKIGTVAETGAVAGAVIPSKDSITVEDAVSDQYYAIFKGDTLIYGWVKDEDGDGVITFDGLESNTDYTIKTIHEEDYDEATNAPKANVTTIDTPAKTQIDPLAPEPGAPEAPVLTTTTDTVVLQNPNSEYSYYLVGPDGSQYEGVLDESGHLVFTGLDEDTIYELYAYTADNHSAPVEAKTKSAADVLAETKAYAKADIEEAAEDKPFEAVIEIAEAAYAAIDAATTVEEVMAILDEALAEIVAYIPPQPEPDPEPQVQPVYRIYNPFSGEHFYTVNVTERNSVMAAGWTYEGIGWYAPITGAPVYRLYNVNGDDHLFTTNVNEKNNLEGNGWIYEGVAFCSGGDKAIYRAYNSYSYTGNHHYSTDIPEYNSVVEAGWTGEGVAFYSVK